MGLGAGVGRYSAVRHQVIWSIRDRREEENNLDPRVKHHSPLYCFCRYTSGDSTSAKSDAIVPPETVPCALKREVDLVIVRSGR